MSANVNNQYDFFKIVNLDNDGNLGVNVIGGGVSPTGSTSEVTSFTYSYADNSLNLSQTGAAIANFEAIINPMSALTVNNLTSTNTLQVTNGATDGYVLTSDATGLASWQAPSGEISSFTYSPTNNTFTITSNGDTFDASINEVSGLTVTNDLVVNGGFQLTTSPTTNYVLTSDASGNGTWQPGGGADTGASAGPSNFRGIGFASNPTAFPAYDYTFRLTKPQLSYSNSQTSSFLGSSLWLSLMYATPGSTIDEIVFKLTATMAAGTGTAELRPVIYRAETDANGRIVPGDLELDSGTSVSTSTTGLKIVSGIGHTLSNNTVENTDDTCWHIDPISWGSSTIIYRDYSYKWDLAPTDPLPTSLSGVAHSTSSFLNNFSVIFGLGA
jgi:hypothetical protein